MDFADISWAERVQLFGWSVSAALLAGALCPLVGVFLFLRRTSFYGIALPQFATAGVVFGFVLLPWWIDAIGLGGMTLDAAFSDTHAAINYHLSWAAVFTFGGLLALVWTGRKPGSEIGRVAAAYAIASAAVFLFGRFSAIGKGHVDQLLLGELILMDVHRFETVALVLGLVLALIVVYQRDLILVSFDPETARVLGKRVTALEALMHAVTGLTVAVGTMSFGPTMLFGLLVLPPLAARRWARSMTSFFALASALGVLAVAAGTVACFTFDLPLGPAIVGAAALELMPGALFGRRRV